MPTVSVKNLQGTTQTCPATGAHFAGLPVVGSFTTLQVKTGDVPLELFEEFMAAMAAGITANEWWVNVNSAVWPVLERSEHLNTSAAADNATFTVTAPTRLMDLGYTPIGVSCYTVGGGAVGARTQTLIPEVDAAGTGFQLTSYNEDTGVLTLTNRTGGALTNPTHVQILWARISQ